MTEAFVDYENHQFVTRDGIRLSLQPISKMVLERLYADQNGKPKPPIVEVTIGGQFVRKEPNPDDPDYKLALKKWQDAKNFRLLKFGIVHGVKDCPPVEFVQEYDEYFPGETEPNMKYLWIVSMMGPDGEDAKMLADAIVGQTVITETGVKEAENSFPGDGTGDASEPIPAVEATD